MSAAGILAVAAVECAKLRAQATVRAVLAACAAGPFAFVLAMRVQSAVPEDTLFGRGVRESGFATPLIVLGFATLWIVPALTSVVGGDLFSSEDRHRMWGLVLTRSRSRAEVFAGKVLTAFGFSSLAIGLLAASSMTAGLLVIGAQPLIDLSGALLAPAPALGHVALAWASVLPPVLSFTALAILVSIATRSSAAGIGVPVLVGLTLQLATYLDGPEWIRRLLITSAFGAWHGLMTEHPFFGPLIQGTAVSGAYVVVCLTIGYKLFSRRDIGG